MRFALWLTVLAVAPAAAQELRFRAHSIDPEIPNGYQTLVADIDGDGRPDVIGLSGRGDTLYWYENPAWTRHVLATGMHRMITLDAADLDGDGIPEIALGTHFGQTEAQSEGRLYLLKHRGDPREPWEAEEIDRLPTTHRVRFADLDSDGQLELVNSPLTGPGAAPPLFEAPTPLVYYRPGEWKRILIDDRLDGVVHGMREADWNGPVILTASFGGVVRFRLGGGGVWERRHLVSGDPSPRPQGGASEVQLGRAGGERFLATIEPWHGHQVAVYRHRGRDRWPREVLDDSLVDGHVLELADFDGDGNDEIVAGFRGAGASLFLYRFDGGRWRKQVLDDGGMAAAGCQIADIDGDGRPDIVCIGASTGNIKWYENLN